MNEWVGKPLELGVSSKCEKRGEMRPRSQSFLMRYEQPEPAECANWKEAIEVMA